MDIKSDMWLTLLDAMSGKTDAIERSEKRGQDEVVRNQRLPIYVNQIPYEIANANIPKDCKTDYAKVQEIRQANKKNWNKNQYEKMGIKIIDECDDLFYNVELPSGWAIKATDHSMWNDVIDNKGRKRISFFYKAAFYDRDAFTNFCQRYTASRIPFDNYKTDVSYTERDEKEWYGVAYDCETEIFKTSGKILTKCIDRKDYEKKEQEEKQLRDEAIKYLDEHFPNWNDINSYWD